MSRKVPVPNRLYTREFKVAAVDVTPDFRSHLKPE